MKDVVYISDEEREKCRKVKEAFAELENEEVDWAAEIQIYDSFVEYAMSYFDRVYDIKRD